MISKHIDREFVFLTTPLKNLLKRARYDYPDAQICTMGQTIYLLKGSNSSDKIEKSNIIASFDLDEKNCD